MDIRSDRCQKAFFSSFSAANEKLAEIHKNHPLEEHKPNHAYRCFRCGGFHLTSQGKIKQRDVRQGLKDLELHQKDNEKRIEAEYWIRKKQWKRKIKKK